MQFKRFKPAAIFEIFFFFFKIIELDSGNKRESFIYP